MRIVLASLCLFALCLGSVPDAQAGPILQRLRANREARRRGAPCRPAPKATGTPATAAATSPACKCSPGTCDVSGQTTGPTVSLWGGTYYPAPTPFVGGCPTGTCAAPKR